MSEAPRLPGRPRSEATRQAVLESSAQLLDAESYRSITIERIAHEAKVGKQSIYRWWDSKADVLLEAFTDRALKRLPAYTPTGNGFRDLESLLQLFFSNVSQPAIAKTLRGLIAEAQVDPEFRHKFHSVFISTRRGMMRELLQSGMAKGEFRARLDVEVMLDLIYGAFWYRLLSGTAAPLDDAFATTLVETLRPIMESRRPRPGKPESGA